MLINIFEAYKTKLPHPAPPSTTRLRPFPQPKSSPKPQPPKPATKLIANRLKQTILVLIDSHKNLNLFAIFVLIKSSKGADLPLHFAPSLFPLLPHLVGFKVNMLLYGRVLLTFLHLSNDVS